MMKSDFSCMKYKKLSDDHFDCMFTSFASYFSQLNQSWITGMITIVVYRHIEVYATPQ